MSHLYVFYKKTLVGVLTKNQDATLSFKYDMKWTTYDFAFGLSPALVFIKNITLNLLIK